MASGLLKSKNKDHLKSNFSFLFHYLSPYLPRFAFSAAAALVSVICMAYTVRIIGGFVDNIKTGKITLDYIQYCIATLLALTVSAGILLYLQRRLITIASRVMEYEIRKDYLDFLHTRPAAFYQQNKTGAVMSRITNDLSQVRDMVGAGILHVLRTGFNLIVIIIFMLKINAKYTGISLLPVILLPLLSLSLIRKMGRLYQTIQERLANINSIVQETFAGMATVEAYNREAWRLQKFTEGNNQYFESNMDMAKLMGFLWPFFMFMAALGTVALLFFGGGAVVRNEMTLGDLVALNFYLINLAWPLISVGWVISLIQRGKSATGRIRNLLLQGPEISRNGNNHFSNGDIDITNLTFAYPNAKTPALKNVSLNIRRGQRIAIVGTIGSGKSTIANLLSRIYEPGRSKIFINRTDIQDISLTRLREHVSIVPQETFLFSDTIKNNIRFGKDCPDSDLEKAVRISRIVKDIQSIPNGLNQMLGERGINLSGGQKQRVAISRAVLRDPAIIILDDCLSSVDADTEAEILKEFETFFPGRTTLIISHRISAIKHADTIYVMDEGRIVEEGTHETLMQKNGLYVKLYERQKIEEELE
jgi:ATP-binding cassette subfamily B protein